MPHINVVSMTGELASDNLGELLVVLQQTLRPLSTLNSSSKTSEPADDFLHLT